MAGIERRERKMAAVLSKIDIDSLTDSASLLAIRGVIIHPSIMCFPKMKMKYKSYR